MRVFAGIDWSTGSEASVVVARCDGGILTVIDCDVILALGRFFRSLAP